MQNANATRSDNAKQTQLPWENNYSLQSDSPITRYMADIRRYPLLSREEEKALAFRVKEHNDKEAAYKLVTSNLRLVIKIALQFQQIWMQNFLDIVQEGNIGLMQAVKKYDPNKNVKFSYYAVFWIKAYIIKFIMDNWSLVKIGTTQAQRKLFYRLKKEKQKLIAKGFAPDPKIISEKLGLKESEVISMEQRLDGGDVLLNDPLKEGNGTQKLDLLKSETKPIEDELGKKQLTKLIQDKIVDLKKQLNSRECELFEQRIFAEDPITLQEFGKRYGISRERARQVEHAIIQKTKKFFKQQLPDFELIAA